MSYRQTAEFLLYDWFDGEKVHLPEASHAAAKAYAESGMLAAAQDYEMGGMQLPCVVEMAANSFFSKAGIGIGGGGRAPPRQRQPADGARHAGAEGRVREERVRRALLRHDVPQRAAGGVEPVGRRHARHA